MKEDSGSAGCRFRRDTMLSQLCFLFASYPLTIQRNKLASIKASKRTLKTEGPKGPKKSRGQGVNPDSNHPDPTTCLLKGQW